MLWWTASAVTADIIVSLRAAIWDDSKSGHKCVITAAPSVHLSAMTGGGDQMSVVKMQKKCIFCYFIVE